MQRRPRKWLSGRWFSGRWLTGKPRQIERIPVELFDGPDGAMEVRGRLVDLARADDESAPRDFGTERAKSERDGD